MSFLKSALKFFGLLPVVLALKAEVKKQFSSTTPDYRFHGILVTSQINVYDSSEKDFPQKDFAIADGVADGKKGWDWHISICPKGHIVELRKSYTAKGVWGSVKCSEFCQKETL